LSAELAETWQRDGTEGSRDDVFAEFALLAANAETVLIYGSQGIRAYRTPAVAQSQYRSEIDVYQFSELSSWQEISATTVFENMDFQRQS
jgi:hypothetical protein